MLIEFQRAIISSCLGKVRFFYSGGEKRGGVSRAFGGEGPQYFFFYKFQVGEDQTCFILDRGKVTVSFFGKEKLLHVASILYIQGKLPVKNSLNYLQVSKNLFIRKLSSPD